MTDRREQCFRNAHSAAQQMRSLRRFEKRSVQGDDADALRVLGEEIFQLVSRWEACSGAKARTTQRSNA